MGLHLSSHRWVFISLQTGGSYLFSNRWAFICLQIGGSSSLFKQVGLHLSSNRWVVICLQTCESSSPGTNNNSYIALYPVKNYKLAALYIINIKQVSRRLSSNRWVVVCLRTGESSSVFRQVSRRLSSNSWVVVCLRTAGSLSVFRQVGLHLSIPTAKTTAASSSYKWLLESLRCFRWTSITP